MTASDLPEVSLFHFGVFDLDPRSGELRKGGTLVKLPPQPFKVLALLASRAGQLVSREEIRQQVWGDETFVDFEQGLNSCIKQIRAALGDDAETPRYVETLARRGYRFVAPVKSITTGVAARAMATEGPASVAPRLRPQYLRLATAGLVLTLVLAGYFGWRAPRRAKSAAPAGKIMLAVLPFQNLSGDPAQAYLSDGFTEEMITQLGRLEPSRLGVIARTSTMQYQNTSKRADQIGRELGVDYILEGSVRRAGEHVRISAQLIQMKDQTHLWAENYDRDLRDVLTLQSDVARAIAREIELNLTPQQQNRLASSRPLNREAFELYLKGRYFWNKRSEEGFNKAIEYFQQAIALDPADAQAYAGLADAYALLGSMPNAEIPRKEAMPRARAAALKALEIDESLAEAHNSLAFVRMHYDWDWLGAEKEFQRAIQLDPGYATAHQWHAFNLMVMGRAEESLAEIHRAQELDPLSLIINTDEVELMYCARRNDDAIRQGRKTIEMDPGFLLAHEFTGLAFIQMKQYAQAIAEFQEADRLSEGRMDARSTLATAYALAGRTGEAREILRELKKVSSKRFDTPIYLSRVYRDLGEKDQALSWLEKAYQERDGSLILLQADPGNDSLRSDPRFQDLLRRIGLQL